MPIIVAYAADILMILASLGAACYCLVLSRRLSRLTSFDKGIGGAIAVLSAQVDDMKSALSEAKSGSDGAGQHLHELVRQARDISGELELMIAACHDFAEEALVVQGTDTTAAADSRGPIAAPATPNEFPGDPALTDGHLAEAAADDAYAAAASDRVQSESDEAAAVPVFGSRRAAPPEPVFRRHATSGAQ